MFSALKKAFGRKGGDAAPAPGDEPASVAIAPTAPTTVLEGASPRDVGDTAPEDVGPVPPPIRSIASRPAPRKPSEDDSDEEGGEGPGGSGKDTRGKGNGKHPQPNNLLGAAAGGAGAAAEPAGPKIVVHPPVPRPVVPPAPAPLAAVPESNGRFVFAATPLAKIPGRIVVAFPIHEYGPGACDLGHVLLATAGGLTAVYKDDEWDAAEPLTQQVPLEEGDEIAAAFQGGYKVGPTLVSARGHVFGIDTEADFKISSRGRVLPMAAGDAVVAAAATTGQSPFALGFKSGIVAVARDNGISPFARVDIGAPVKPGPDGLRIDYYGNYIAAQHADAPIVTLIAGRGSKAELSIVGRILHGGRFVPEGALTQPQRSTSVAEGANEGRDAPAIVSMTGDGTDLFITYADGSATYVKAYESGYPHKVDEVRVALLTPSPCEGIPAVGAGTPPSVHSILPLSLSAAGLGAFVGGAAGGRVGIMHAPEWEKDARGDYRDCKPGPRDGHRCFLLADVLPAGEGPVSLIAKVKGNASSAPWFLLAVSASGGAAAVLKLTDAAAGAAWAEALARRPVRYDG